MAVALFLVIVLIVLVAVRNIRQVGGSKEEVATEVIFASILVMVVAAMLITVLLF